ncbi:MAG: tRNA (5-methylaminomethyl-2-thiouridine)(34)-methyltransferase MnmD [Bacteroidetes bacterium]|nr:tRNA (5-methylaminomethyl-2-thiouridine)(34)-methyltransferase MnmD [Bacteroidota bacterium]MBU1373310.1 tRNA (5-methylaminomethyl-2-thiouridine)(34)-methyltransferase MnmD [Bacteroidota bacterium]MBU1484401.1 tRNA (5-methylaminomethyl-2-thiouridine)(34)-methyltransferase MnmD [Bacteroidota bacterium]MBU1761723.1 tRNA (5-methylaminomethyl-2-thiouridine)(34)-methyltransferase MnmD [Bacteroidota bacterium]MBU2047029.1 tRNA (5-methylaminomethyl-2-thiouridine)(34)-methyltransferase MnmD [Bactero
MSESLELKIVITADGSKTIYHPIIKENYHSRNGALQESNHVFLNSGLRYYLADKQVENVSILEVGFGTGLNFLLTNDFCTGKEIILNYVGLEAYPLSLKLIEDTEYHQIVSSNSWEIFLENYEKALTESVMLNQFCSLHIACIDAKIYTTNLLFDVIYFDAFASSNQPELWTKEFITHIVSFLKPGGVFVTYAITGDLKRIMKSLGLKIEKAPGAAGKREMLRAIKP